MTRTNSSASGRNLRPLIALALVLEIALPAVILAQTPPPNAGGSGANFCDRIATLKTNTTQRLTDRESKLAANRTTGETNLANTRKSRSDKLASERTKQDQRRNSFYDKLNAKADTDVKKQALAIFKSTMDAAQIARRAAVDSAIQAFQTGVDQAVATRHSSIDAAIATLSTSMTAAFDKAASDCAAGTAPATVRTDLRAALQAAHDKFESDRKAIDKMPTTLQPLIASRRQAVQTAINAFKATAEKARSDLKTAFGTTQ